MTRALLLDRDGTLIDIVRDEETGAITTAFHPSQIRFLPGVIDALKIAKEAGFSLGIATNQPGPAKGHFSINAVSRTNAAMLAQLVDHGVAIDACHVCMHHPEGGPGGDASLVRVCDCRKPAPGLVHSLLAAMSADARESWMIGDTATDVQAGQAAGVRTGLVFSLGRCELCPIRGGPIVRPDVTGATLSDVIASIVSRDVHANRL